MSVDKSVLPQVGTVRQHLQDALGSAPDSNAVHGFEDELTHLNDALMSSHYDGGTQAFDALTLLQQVDSGNANPADVHDKLQQAVNDINQLYDKVNGASDAPPPSSAARTPKPTSGGGDTTPPAASARTTPTAATPVSHSTSGTSGTGTSGAGTSGTGTSAARSSSTGSGTGSGSGTSGSGGTGSSGAGASGAGSSTTKPATGGGSGSTTPSSTGTSGGGTPSSTGTSGTGGHQFANEGASGFSSNGVQQGGQLASALDNMSNALGLGKGKTPTNFVGSIIQALGGLSSLGGGANNPMGMFGSVFKAMSNGDLSNMLRPGDSSKAGQFPAQPDEALAQQNAQKFINSVDWSSGKIGMWVPGTGSHDLNQDWANSLGPGVSSAALDYPSDIDMPSGIATAMRTAQIVLDYAKQKGAKVALAGYSQGAWAADNIASMKGYNDAIASTVVYGEPLQSNARNVTMPNLHRHSHSDDAYANTVDPASLLNMNLQNPQAHGSYDFAEDGAWQRSMWNSGGGSGTGGSSTTGTSGTTGTGASGTQPKK